MQRHWCCPRTLSVALLPRVQRGHGKVQPTGFFLAVRCGHLPVFAIVQYDTGIAARSRGGLHKPRDGPVNLIVEVFHKQDHLWHDFYDPTSFLAYSSHHFLMLHSDSMPPSDTTLCTIATNDSSGEKPIPQSQ